MLKKGMIAAAFIVALVLGACQNPPVNNIVDAPLGAPPGVTLDQVREAIMFAGAKRGWEMRQEVPGKIIASHKRSGHLALVDVLYNTSTFSIVYLQSANLQFDDGTVHPTYNRWIEFLEQDIKSYAAVLSTDGAAPEPASGAPDTVGVAPDATDAPPAELVPTPDTGGAMPATDGAAPAAGSQL